MPCLNDSKKIFRLVDVKECNFDSIIITFTTIKMFFHNLNHFLACMVFLTILSVMVLLSGNLSMALIILASAFHLSCKFLAGL